MKFIKNLFTKKKYAPVEDLNSLAGSKINQYEKPQVAEDLHVVAADISEALPVLEVTQDEVIEISDLIHVVEEAENTGDNAPVSEQVFEPQVTVKKALAKKDVSKTTSKKTIAKKAVAKKATSKKTAAKKTTKKKV